MTELPADLTITPLNGAPRTVAEIVSMFHLAAVVLDPYTHESAWLLETGGRVLHNFREADCRAAFILTCDEAGARQFLGPWADRVLVLCDPDRTFVAAMELERLPAFVHIAQDHSIVGKAEGWDPDEWRAVAENLADMMSWSRPTLPAAGDPVPYEGTPAA